MAKYNLSLSAKADSIGNRQVMVRATISRDVRFRFKSGVWINPSYFDDEANSIIIPKKGRLNYVVVNATESAKAQLDSFINRIDRVCGSMSDHMDDLTVDFVEKAMKVTSNMAVSDISYYSIMAELDRAKEEEKNRERLANKVSFFELMNIYLTKKDFSETRKRAFRVLVRQLQRYQSFVRATDRERKDFTLLVESMDSEVLEDFFDYFRNEKELSEEYPDLFKKIMLNYPAEFSAKHKLSVIEERGKNTFVKTMKMFKAFFNWCNENDITKNNPFDGVKIGVETYGTPFYLTLEERNIIADADLPKIWEGLSDEEKKDLKEVSGLPIATLEVQRDIFVFQCLIGCRVGDLLKLTRSNVINNAVEYIAGKTKEKKPLVVRVPLNGRARALVNKYQGDSEKSRLMPFIAAQNYNDAIKAILLMCGIKRNVTILNPTTGDEEQQPIWKVASSHMARRTFIGNLYKKVQDPNLIGSMSGHAEGSKAFVRYRNIDEDMKKNIVSLID